jgi:small subunit ribosomal protein S20
MPKIRSAKKALRQNLRRKKINLMKKEAYKEAIKNFKKLIAQNKLEEAQKTLSLVFKKLDKAAKSNTIHKNKASRLKSRLNLTLNKKSKTNS